jgi:hypothetical protein
MGYFAASRRNETGKKPLRLGLHKIHIPNGDIRNL